MSESDQNSTDTMDRAEVAAHAMQGDLIDLDVEAAEPCGWNANEMDADTFDRLCQELSVEDGGVGMIDPIQVVKMKPDDRHAAPWFQIMGGEHRWRAAKVLGWPTIPAVVLRGERWDDQDLRKFVTVRLNALHGKLNPKKFADLYRDVAQRHSEEALQGLMAFTDKDAWNNLTSGISKSLEKAGVPKKKIKQFEKATKELGQVKDLSAIIGRLFQEHGEDLKQNFMVLSFGGKEHLYIDCTPEVFKTARAMASHCKDQAVDINDVLAALLAPWRPALDAAVAAKPAPSEDPSQAEEGGGVPAEEWAENEPEDLAGDAPELEPEPEDDLAPPPRKKGGKG